MNDAKFDALVLELKSDDTGIYPMGHLPSEAHDNKEMRATDAYKCGWNACAIATTKRIGDAIDRARAGVDDDRTMLLASGWAFMSDEKLLLNMNDMWSWATSWFVEVTPADQGEVARLFRTYGGAGLLYWNSRKEGDMRSEFHHVNRMLDFVTNEERIRAESASSIAHAYRRASYTIGV